MYILLVDDDNVFHFISSSILKLSGVNLPIHSVTSGSQGLEAVLSHYRQEELPEAIFIDVNMPVMNGFEFIDDLRKLGVPLDKTKLVVLTSSDNEDDQQKAKMRGVTFLTKPISKDDCHFLFQHADSKSLTGPLV